MVAEALADATSGWALAPVLLWLFREGRFLADPNDLTRALALRPVGAGAPLVRLSLAGRRAAPGRLGRGVDARQPLDRDRVARAGCSGCRPISAARWSIRIGDPRT